jgi:hypothetical protein
MTTLWDKLNLKEGQEIVVVNAPKSFAAALKALPRSRVFQQRISTIKELTFVERKSELDKLSAAVIAKASGDAVRCSSSIRFRYGSASFD